MFSSRREEIETAMRYFILAPRVIARKQAARLIRAKSYMDNRGIRAIVKGNGFEYQAATGSVLK